MPPSLRVLCAWILGSVCLSSSLLGCTPPSAALKTVAEQNQQNVGALSKDVQTLLLIYEPLLKATGESLMFQHIAHLEAELIAIVGPPTLELKAEDWDTAFKLAADSYVGRKLKFAERYQQVKTSPPAKADDIEAIQFQEGWIYSAVNNPEFTPQKAHDILKTLLELRRSNQNGEDYNYYEEAERRLLPYDPALAFKRNTLTSADAVLTALQQEISQELDLAVAYAQAVAAYSQSEIDMGSAVRSLDGSQITQLLTDLSTKYISNQLYRTATVTLLTKGTAFLMK